MFLYLQNEKDQKFISYVWIDMVSSLWERKKCLTDVKIKCSFLCNNLDKKKYLFKYIFTVYLIITCNVLYVSWAII